MPRGKSRKAVALYVNPGKPAVRRVLPRIVKFLSSYGIEPLGLDSQADDLPRTLPLYSAAELGRRARFALVLGGDARSSRPRAPSAARVSRCWGSASARPVS